MHFDTSSIRVKDFDITANLVKRVYYGNLRDYYYTHMFSRPAQNFRGKECETQRWKLGKNVTAHQFQEL